MAKSIGCYKGFRGLYEKDTNDLRDNCFIVKGYRSGYKYKEVFTIVTQGERNIEYEFRKQAEMMHRTRNKNLQEYFDLIDRFPTDLVPLPRE